jgi:hypothetical protein
LDYWPQQTESNPLSYDRRFQTVSREGLYHHRAKPPLIEVVALLLMKAMFFLAKLESI